MKKYGLPSAIVEYTKNVFSLEKDNPITKQKFNKALNRFPRKVIRDIGKLVNSAAKVVGVSAEEMINSLDFHPHDFPSTKIESLFSELRVINYLSDEGFNNIRFIPSKRKKRRADIRAFKDSISYIVEVTCSTSEVVSNKWTPEQILNFIIQKWNDKKSQFEDTLKEYTECRRIALAVVLDTEDRNALTSSKDALLIAKLAWLKIGVDNLHICIITGYSDQVYDIPRNSLIHKILSFSSKKNYIKTSPFIINLLNSIIRVFYKPISSGNGNIVYPSWVQTL